MDSLHRAETLAGFLLIAFAIVSSSFADDSDSPTTKQAERKQSLEVMLGQAKRMVVRVGTKKDSSPCELKEVPLIHYSDQVRRLPESTLWVWEQLGAPALFCKIERISEADGTTKMWQYCCVPATAAKADVTWGRTFRWRSREQDFRWMPLAEAPDPRDQPRARLVQMKAIAREFTGRTEQTPAKSQQEMRLLASPLHQYASPEQRIIDGAVFCLTSNGTNPDALLVVEAIGGPKEKSEWRYSIVGLTGDAAEVSRNMKVVWSKPFSDGPGDHRSWMWYVSPP